MAGVLCGVYYRNKEETAVGVIDAMLASLPGQGRAERIDLDERELSFGYRELWAHTADAVPPSVWCTARGLSVVADVRLDNRVELLNTLGVVEPEKSVMTDAELILCAYERWGEECPRHLYGDYAFALWDSAKRLLYCARDALGVRPFFYSRVPGGQFVFASDIKAVLAAPSTEDDLDEAEATVYLMGQPMGVGGTFFRSVRSLPPGYCIVVGTETERLLRWWHPENVAPVVHESDGDYEGKFLDLYRRAIRERLRGVHTPGVHLSGGLDSSSVAVLAARELRPSGVRPLALCWHPPPDDSVGEEEAAEYSLIESVCAQEGLQPHYHRVSAEHMLAMLLNDITQLTDRDGTLIHETLVQQTATKLGVRVILSGWGGDEFASYSGTGYYVELLRGGRLRRLWREACGLSKHPWRFVVRYAILPQFHWKAASVTANLLRGKMPSRRESYAHPELLRRHGRRRRNSLGVTSIKQEQLKRLSLGHLGQRMEDWAAQGARAGIEYRYPLLDRRLVEFILGLPAEQFRRCARSRNFMRRTLRSVLPSEILELSEKRDPARYRPLQDATVEAAKSIAQRLDNNPEPPGRTEYINMPRLRSNLQAIVGGESGPRGKLSRTLRFILW